MQAIRDTISEVVAAQAPMTVRQVFYQLVGLDVVPKTETQYKGTVCRLLAEMRLDGTIPFDWIADSTRWMRKPDTWDSAEQYIRSVAHHYRQAVWRDLDDYVEVWIEKEALAGVVYKTTDQYDVPLMVTRGYPSISYVYEAANTISASGKDAYVYYFGDHDPSGLDIARNVEERLAEWTYGAVTFERVAVNEEQVARWSLPTRPTKRSDPRSRSFVGRSVELDAIPAPELRALVDECIHRHIGEDDLAVVKVAEESERAILRNIAGTMAGPA